MWSQYPNSEKTKHLELSVKFWLKFLSNVSSIREKIQTPLNILFYVLKNTSMKISLWSKNTSFWILLCFPKT